MSQLAFVKLSNIHIWTENPRTGYTEDIENGIITLIEEQKNKSGNKLIALAKSIIKANGIYEPIGVLKYKDGFMIVKEGNRRITCLKLLKNPEIIRDKYEKLSGTFEKLKSQADASIFNNIPARIFNEDENDELEEWIELRHNGVKKGEGLDTWGAREKDNWRKYRGKNTPLLNFHEELIKLNILNKDQINSVNKTNWERILGVAGRNYLGIIYENKRYEIAIPIEKFKNIILKTVQKLNGQSVAIVYDKEHIKRFFEDIDFDEEISEEDFEETKDDDDGNGDTDSNKESSENTNSNRRIGGNEAPSGKDKNTNFPEGGEKSNNSGESSISQSGDEGSTEENSDSKKSRRSTKPAPLLSNLICDLKSSQDTDGIIRMSIEIKKMSKKKDYMEYPIATAMLMRNLLEQCLIYYLKKRNKWSKFHNQKKNEPTLTEIIEKYKADSDIFAQDDKLKRNFIPLDNTTGLKEYFNLIVHHPHKFAATPDFLDSISQNGYLSLIQHLIDYQEK